MADLRAQPSWALSREELERRLQARYAAAGPGERVSGMLLARLVAGDLGDLRADRVTAPERERLAVRAGGVAEVDAALVDLVAVGHNVPPPQRRAGWGVELRADVPGLLPLALARRLVVALETQRSGPVEHRDRWGPYAASETPTMGAVELLACLGAMRAQLGLKGTVGRQLLLSDRRAWAMLRGRRSPPSQNERRLLWQRLGVLERVRLELGVGGHRKDAYLNEDYAYSGGVIEEVLVRCADGQWRPYGQVRAGVGEGGDELEPGGGAGPRWAVVLTPEYEAALDAHPVYLSREVLREAPAAGEKRLYIDQQGALGPAFNTTHRPASSQPKREHSFYDASPVYRTLGLCDGNHARRLRRLKAMVSWVGHNCQLYSDPTWELHRGKDGQALMESDPAHEGRARPLVRFGLSRDPREGTGLRGRVDRRRVAERLQDAQLSSVEEISAAKRARAEHTRRRRLRTEQEMAQHARERGRRRAPRRQDTLAQLGRGQDGEPPADPAVAI